MQHRGSTFWLWADCELHHRTHTEVLNDGTIIDVQSRLSRKGVTQLFLGVYSEKHRVAHEEAYVERVGETMTTALLWGVGKARSIAAESAASFKSHHFHGPAARISRPR
ncbi:hypothetical protein [Pseudomonas sp. D4-18]|uniref:hypothetical protein n=1 Tax=Pseudomonas sp. D4-18 TaxID=2817395 RepID=UPI003DA9D497